MLEQSVNGDVSRSSRIPAATAFALVPRPPGQVRDGWRARVLQCSGSGGTSIGPRTPVGKPNMHPTPNTKLGWWDGNFEETAAPSEPLLLFPPEAKRP